MSGSSTTPLYSYIEPTGVIVPDTTSLKATVQAEWLAALGQALDIDDSSPAGVLIAAEVASRAAVVNNNAAMANQINPNQAAGQFLDAIGALTEQQRTPQAQSYYPDVALSGSANLPIPAGTQAKTSNGDVFQTTAAVTLNAAGVGTADMLALVYGPVAVPSGPLTLISSVLGLTSLVAGSDGVVGNSAMSDVAFRSFRRQTLSMQGRSVNGALYSAVKSLSFVSDIQFLENNTDASATISGITLAANSFWFCVNDGAGGANVSTGAPDAVTLAQTILQYKGTGANWNGAQTATVTDPITGQPYAVEWDIPTAVPIMVRATVSQGTFTGTLNDNVTNAILAYAANSVDGIEGLVTGNSVSAFEIAGAVTAQVPGIQISNMEIGTVAGGTYGNATLAIALNQLATLTSGNIDVVITT